MSKVIDAVVEKMPISNLLLDPQNPRIPADRRAGNQIDIACELVINENSLEVAQSIALQGVYPHEALIAIPSEIEGKFIVVEGNRRLSALLGLVDSSFRAQYFDSEFWEELAKDISLNYSSKIPVMVMPDRISVVSIIGDRHLRGNRPWTPFSQANYIATLLEDYEMLPERAAQVLQMKKSDMMEKYRELLIARQVGELNIDTARLENNFSLLTVAMSNSNIRKFIDAPTAAQVQVQTNPISDNRIPELKELVSYVYGDGEVEAKIADSRQMTTLGKALSNSESLAVLRNGGTLDQAIEKLSPAPMSVAEQLNRQLLSAKNALEGATNTAADLTEEVDFSEILGAIQGALVTVRNKLES